MPSPTEPGSAGDGFTQVSTTRLEQVCSAAPNSLSTRARPAYWLAPGETGFCDRGARVAKNETILSDNLFEKEVTIGYRGLDNVIVFDATITLERDYKSLFTKTPTGYLSHEFTARYRFDPSSGLLGKPRSQTTVKPWSYLHTSLLPPILATPDGTYAMGVYTAENIETYEMLFYDVPNPWDRTNKWTIVKHEVPAPAGKYRYRSFVVVGTLDHVRETLAALYQMHRTDTNPPEGYVDVANCDEIAGWAWDPKNPNTPITVEIYGVIKDGQRILIFESEASNLRSDLPPVLKDNGRHGFLFKTNQVVSDQRPHILEIEACNSNSQFSNVKLQPEKFELSCAN